MKIIGVVGARPNFMKIAPIYNQFKHKEGVNFLICHTGQHYDFNMSKKFFEDLEIPEPHFYLGVGSGTHAEQKGKVMMEFEKILFKEKPDWVMVVGDVNSTLAAALAAVKLHIPVCHVEAGLRSFDDKMPEEINRKLTDSISQLLFTHSPEADKNLLREGIPKEKIFLVGNVMIDTLIENFEKIKKSEILQKLGLKEKEYCLLTLHRPENVDEREKLEKILKTLDEIAEKIRIVFPIHPRTSKNIKSFGLSSLLKNIYVIEPVGYIDFLNLEMNALFVITDSGGVQEETMFLNVPCLTLRKTTERPITIKLGTNILCKSTEKLKREVDKILKGKIKKSKGYKLWDGKTSQRIKNILMNFKPFF